MTCCHFEDHDFEVYSLSLLMDMAGDEPPSYEEAVGEGGGRHGECASFACDAVFGNLFGC